MFTTVQIRDEYGAVLDEMHDRGEINGLTARVWEDQSLARSLSCLRFIDPYGNTVFNRVQAEELADELRRVADVDSGVLGRLTEMADRVGSDVHLYLWLLGD